jgi:hypothetical protein
LKKGNQAIRELNIYISKIRTSRRQENSKSSGDEIYSLCPGCGYDYSKRGIEQCKNEDTGAGDGVFLQGNEGGSAGL